MRYVLLVQYDGTEFSGYQTQKNGRTVQGALEEAAAEIFGVPAKVAASGRTDAGVHAMGQVCHLDGETSTPPEKLRERFNALLPPDVRILKSAAAPAGFDCTRGAKKKTYCYRFYTAGSDLPLLERYAVRVREAPDLFRMETAASLMEGEHNFKAFCASGSSAKTSVRTVYKVEIRKTSKTLFDLYEIRVTGNGFLYNMVRILAGELVCIGCGKGIEDMLKAFETGERALLAKTMPAKGLMLENVDYGVPLFGTSGEE